MGLQDALVMSVVPAHDVIKSRVPPFTAPVSSTLEDGKASVFVETFQSMTINNENVKNDTHKSSNNDSVNKNSADKNGAAETSNGGYDNDRQSGDDDIGHDDISDDDVELEIDEVKLSKALHSWMPNYVITPLPRQAHTLRQPVFSARLGRESNNRGGDSSDSTDTQLSLFGCSSHGSRKSREKKRRRLRRRLRRRKTRFAETARDLNPQSSSAPSSHGSRWAELAKRRKGELDRFMMAQSHVLSQGFNLLEESEAFHLCDADEQRALYLCGTENKLVALGANLKKSSSMSNIQQPSRPKKKLRVASAGAKTFVGKPLDFQELRWKMMNQRLAARSLWQRLRTSARARSQHRSHSKHSHTSAGSSDVFLSTATLNNPRPPASEDGRAGGVRGRDGGRRAGVRFQRRKEQNVSVWKGDSQILAIDLKRELTTKVKQRIASTTSALERVTGMGDNNEQKPDYTCHLREFPTFVDEDYGLRPKIPQKIRISPHLSDVIQSDIRVRVGRPRYHEIRVRDLEVWNRGQTLDRAQRNLKVFNWLHSLKEDEFDVASLQQSIYDPPPDLDDVTFGDMIWIRAVDDPDRKPLFQRIKTYVR